MLSPQEVIKAVDILNEYNISLIWRKLIMEIPLPGGTQDITIQSNELQEVLADRDAFIARKFGVTKDHYHRWLEFIEYPQCSAVTKKGTQCKNECGYVQTEMQTPDNFDPKANYFCTTHTEHIDTFAEAVDKSGK